ncbi:SDR family NAD(P)-dependent oxidoreductase [uncultured Roseovarius sp.]|uniref:SDR family NAD(P)-dependent oxidoreductase n=1 Tax=uncultured Roseovarius sp. TaxID=293344 RepID=UPI002633579F|nr:SDR family NAD(P)-dependent oxidoreductase [uncultured Roseovarius sp.]
MTAPKPLSGKHVLVSGGGTGIGLAIARALADQGAQVTITGRRADVLERVAGNGLHPAAMDVTDEAQLTDTIAAAVEQRGPIQICIANAGIAEGRALHKTDMEFWRRTMATNLDGAFLTIRESLTSMRQTDWGRVIAISSIAGLKGLKGAAAYTASKHGMIGLIRALSEDYLGAALTFNAVCPAYVDTEIISRNVTSIQERAGISADDARALMIDANKHKRLIAPSEVAQAVLWLCGPGSESINGQAIEIAGGQF